MSRTGVAISRASLVLLLALNEAFFGGVFIASKALLPALQSFLLCRWFRLYLYLAYGQRNWYDVTSRVIESAQPSANALRLLSSDVGVGVSASPCLFGSLKGLRCLDGAVLGYTPTA